jgi:hypothetical protein
MSLEKEALDYECAFNAEDFNGDFSSIKLEFDKGLLSAVLNGAEYPIVLKKGN